MKTRHHLTKYLTIFIVSIPFRTIFHNNTFSHLGRIFAIVLSLNMLLKMLS